MMILVMTHVNLNPIARVGKVIKVDPSFFSGGVYLYIRDQSVS